MFVTREKKLAYTKIFGNFSLKHVKLQIICSFISVKIFNKNIN